MYPIAHHRESRLFQLVAEHRLRAFILAVAPLAITGCHALLGIKEDAPGCRQDEATAGKDVDRIQRAGGSAAVSLDGRWQCVHDDSANTTREFLWEISQNQNRVTAVVNNNTGDTETITGAVEGSWFVYTTPAGQAGRLQIDGNSMRGWRSYRSADTNDTCQKANFSCVKIVRPES